ncbi:GntR family transcriptional regulator [Stackebrandtia nassauensis]|uniref:Transcriptional regulator, GntR family n=1 Tax=Stackebrandtia nassauensis (strain DSM 44728 / CIP 108903 / NRRL B-16338 / NBRC 102104 / LLR-40K-21) TaxID=446470 RepID=D3Q484_STANL|nr:GntR family transcriptional regulator [Stackebrandtia nassauensis]ADD45969.1 transcriptional regulator, GntR family [Stackebrandtia nassauensis DSM 44728]
MTTPPPESFVYESRTVDPPTRNSTAEFVAGLLRTEIADGKRQPGDKLPEAELCELHQVSRNTLREAFQLLTHERLVIHNLNRGFKVRRPSAEDLSDIYRVRRVIECGAIRSAVIVPERLAGLQRAVADGERAAKQHDGRAVGSANIQFHRSIGSLAESARIDEVMNQVLAELRLVFHVMGNHGDFHLPYLPRNREILDCLAEHDIMRASQLLSNYLDDAEEQLQAAYEEADS